MNYGMYFSEELQKQAGVGSALKKILANQITDSPAQFAYTRKFYDKSVRDPFKEFADYIAKALSSGGVGVVKAL